MGPQTAIDSTELCMADAGGLQFFLMLMLYRELLTLYSIRVDGCRYNYLCKDNDPILAISVANLQLRQLKSYS